VLDPDDHPDAVDIGVLQASRFRRPQPRRVGRCKRGTGLQARHRFEKAHDFVGVQHHRQLARLARVGDALRDLAMAERHAIKEPQRTDRLVQRRPRNAGRHQMDLEGTDIFQTQPVRRAAKIAAELGDGMKVRSLRRRRQIADGHVLDHTAAQRAHLGHRGAPVSRIGLQQPQSSQTGALPSIRLPHSRASGFVQSRYSTFSRVPQHEIPCRVSTEASQVALVVRQRVIAGNLLRQSAFACARHWWGSVGSRASS